MCLVMLPIVRAACQRGQCVSKIPDLSPAFGDGSAFGDDSFSHPQIEFCLKPLPSQD